MKTRRVYVYLRWWDESGWLAASDTDVTLLRESRRAEKADGIVVSRIRSILVPLPDKDGAK